MPYSFIPANSPENSISLPVLCTIPSHCFYCCSIFFTFGVRNTLRRNGLEQENRFVLISAENYLLSFIIIILVYQKNGKERTSDCLITFSSFKMIATVYISEVNEKKSMLFWVNLNFSVLTLSVLQTNHLEKRWGVTASDTSGLSVFFSGLWFII